MSRLVVTDYKNIANSKMPHLDYEVEDFQFYTWNITGWSDLQGEVISPEFVAGGWRWCISLYPLGNTDNDVVSIFLEFADQNLAPNGWHSCAQFAFALWNPVDPKKFVYHGSDHRFTAEIPSMGYHRFCEHRNLFVPLKNQARSLIEDDSCNITAFVRIIKDPTGFLWHDFKNYDSKKATGYITLKNEGTTGYLNATLQTLFCLTYFRKCFIGHTKYFLSNANVRYSSWNKELMKLFGWDSLNSFMQHDAHEFNNVLRNNLENKMENINAISKLFAGKIKSYIKCIKVNYESSRVEDYYDIQLSVKGCKTLDDSLKNYIKEEKLKGNNKYHTENYGLQDAIKGVIFESFPSVLQLQLKRFEYNAQMPPIHDRLEFPMEIDLQKYLSQEADKSKPHKYLLYGVLVHSGCFDNGYYSALIRPRKNDKWLKFNDDRVILVTDKEVFENSYGGHGKFSSAYVLVYIRESDIDDVLSPMLPEDIPEHLQKRLDKQKIEEAEEQILFYVPRFWALENYMIRPITDNYLSLPMNRICSIMGFGQNELKLYLEIAHKPINDETWFPVGYTHVIIFIKYFDANTQYLE
ncbi:hypothetical protein C2G38_2233121 [Gigaspora rosea]|uniref:USP domain-containing protein n=1 Tax=Gigaspora rosea TaxID=44941 RepID=A0A397U103_9GLOM|nr:hypothetical protein C2G38_2233121 [Gigaspora rosea]